MYTFGFIGTGNMGGALAAAARRSLEGRDVILANRTQAKAEALAADLGCDAGDNDFAALNSKYIILGVKPQMMADTLAGIVPILKARGEGFILVSMAAGLTTNKICEMAGGDCPVIRIMPNTPAAIGKGVVLCCKNSLVAPGDYETFKGLLSGAGTLADLPEHLIDAGTAVSGCGPAFASMFIEALADGGVHCGLTRAVALELAALGVAGAAELMLQSGKHPGQLKDEVCSPGGTTIAGVLALEKSGFRGAAMEAVVAAFNRTKVVTGEKKE